MPFDRSKIDSEIEALLKEDTFGDFDFSFADEVEVSEVSGVRRWLHLRNLFFPFFTI
jgi:hypothetical protein